MILVRHGESEFNVRFARTRVDPGIRDPELTARGREQVAASARFLLETGHRERLTAIVASPYTRALQSAEILARRLDLPVRVDARIGEHAHFACDIGTPRSTLAARWPAIAFDHLDETWWPAREDETAVARRAAGFRRAMADAGDWTGLLAVTHWGFIRGLTGHRVPNAAVLRFDPEAPHPTGAEWLHPPEAAAGVATPPGA